MSNRRNINFQQWQLFVKNYSANVSLKGMDSGICATNANATGNITVTLPAAKSGLAFRAFVAAAHTLTFAPQSVDNFRGKGAGVSLANGTIGSYISISCVVAGTWEIDFNIGPFA